MMIMYEKGKLYDIPIIDLRTDPNQPRKSIEPQALADLTESIKLQGIIQPILFRVTPESPYLIIVAGERRFMAAQNAGLFTVPGIFVEGNTAEIALVENLQRQDLTCIEEAEALKKLMDDAKYTQEQLAGVIGKPRATIADTLSLTNLPVEIRDECRGDRTVSKTRLIDISRKKQQRAMTTAYAKYREELRKAQGGGTKKRVTLTAGAALCQALDKTRERVEKTDLAALSAEDRQAANDSFNSLREAIDNCLNPSSGGGLA
ncbi:MAG: ParB/RepB/Spo0J family partition protein [Syntrophales bacterium]